MYKKYSFNDLDSFSLFEALLGLMLLSFIAWHAHKSIEPLAIPPQLALSYAEESMQHIAHHFQRTQTLKIPPPQTIGDYQIHITVLKISTTHYLVQAHITKQNSTISVLFLAL